MPKYYVQCGPIQLILLADSAEQAALSALDRTLQSHQWIYDDENLTEEDCREHLMLEALLHLDPSVRVSQRGFNRVDADLVGTPETVEHWHQLIVGMNRLFVAAGLPRRKPNDVAASSIENAEPSPRHPR